jgi:hypothetical protein
MNVCDSLERDYKRDSVWGGSGPGVGVSTVALIVVGVGEIVADQHVGVAAAATIYPVWSGNKN